MPNPFIWLWELFFNSCALKYICMYVFGCAGPLLLPGSLSCCSARASRYSGFSCCRAWALGHTDLNSCSVWPQSLRCVYWVAPWCVRSAQTTYWTWVSWQVNSLLLSHQGSQWELLITEITLSSAAVSTQWLWTGLRYLIYIVMLEILCEVTGDNSRFRISLLFLLNKCICSKLQFTPECLCITLLRFCPLVPSTKLFYMFG